MSSKFVYDDGGIRELLKSGGVRAVVAEHAQRVAGRAGSEYAYSIHDTEQRCIANVYPNSEDAAQDNYENNTLLKALGG